MEKIKSRIYVTVMFCALLSVAFALLSNGRQKDFYYISIYLGIVGLLMERNILKFKKFNIAYPIILLGIVKLVWFFVLQHESGGYNFYSDQFNGGKKLVLGGLLTFYLTQCSHYLNNIDYKKILLLVISIGFIAATCYGIWQSFQGENRVEMAINRATISAYIYSTLSITLIYLLYPQRKKVYYFIAAFVIVLSFITVILTGTRAAIICHLLIIACMTLYNFRKIHIKSVVVVAVISVLAVTILYNRYIHPKLTQTFDEIALYQEGRDNTSLGARFSMWTVGLNNFGHAPFGQSAKSRSDYSKQYVKDYPQYKAAMLYIDVHLHDETIETLSLQGIFGGLALLFFYFGIGWVALKNRNVPLLFTINCMIVYGLSDVLLLSSEAILFYVALIGLCGAISNDQRVEC
jgi:O-antigen ligase